MSVQVNNINLILHGGGQAEAKKKKSGKSVAALFNLEKGGAKSFSFEALLNYGKKIKSEELYTFANQLAILVGSGVPLLSALQIIKEQTEDAMFKKVVGDVADTINSGSTLTQALSRHPKIFPKLFVSMVRAAEKAGEMVEILKQLALYLEQENKLKKKIKAATSYPKFIFGFFVLVLSAIIFGLVPKFKSIFEGFGAELPLPTQILLGISNFAKENLLYELVGVVGLIVLLIQFKKTPKGISVFDKLKLKLPVIGEIVQKSAISKFTRTLSILLSSGVSLVDSLEIAGATTENVHFIRAIQKTRIGVIGGESLHARLKQHTIFPIMVISMVATGEQSGSLDEMLLNVSSLYDTHVDNRVSGLTSIMEPALMIGLGVIALIVIIALYLPIFFMGNVIQ